MYRHFSLAYASLPIRPSTETKKMKMAPLLEASIKLCTLFYRSAIAIIFYRIFVTYDTASIFITPIPKIQSVPCAHNSLIRSLTLYYESTAIPSGLLDRLYPN